MLFCTSIAVARTQAHMWRNYEKVESPTKLRGRTHDRRRVNNVSVAEEPAGFGKSAESRVNSSCFVAASASLKNEGALSYTTVAWTPKLVWSHAFIALVTQM